MRTGDGRLALGMMAAGQNDKRGVFQLVFTGPKQVEPLLRDATEDVIVEISLLGTIPTNAAKIIIVFTTKTNIKM